MKLNLGTRDDPHLEQHVPHMHTALGSNPVPYVTEVVRHIFIVSMQEMEVGRSKVQGYSRLYGKFEGQPGLH